MLLIFGDFVFRMEPLGTFGASYLLEPEIDYELRIRNCGITKTTKEKKSILSRLLARERDNKKSLIVEGAYEYDFNTEKAAIEKTLSTISDHIALFEGTTRDPLFAQIRSRLNQMSGRAIRIPVKHYIDPAGTEPRVTSAEVIAYQRDLYATCLQLEADALNKAESQRCPSPLPQAFQVPPTFSVAPPVPQVVACTSRSVPISEWGVKFNGDVRHLYSFLERVSLLAQSREVKDDDLFKSAVEFFVGDAFAWFKRIKLSGSVNDWPSLVQRLKKDFLPQDQDEDIWNQVKSRKQRRNESIHIFVSHLDMFFNRLSRAPAEVTKVKYIRQNLLPEYFNHLALCDMNTVEELVNLCRKIEENLNLKSKQSCSQDPSLNSLSLNEDSVNNFKGKNSQHNFSGHNKKNNSYNFHQNRVNNSRQKANPTQENSLVKKDLVCWNCDQLNHTFGDCKLKRKTFCYKCGAKNVKVSSCLNCSKN